MPPTLRRISGQTLNRERTTSLNMKAQFQLAVLALLFSTANAPFSSALGFEGRISATLTRGGEIRTFLYTVGTNQLRIERGETDRPYAKDIVNLDTGDITLVYPHNRSFVRINPAAENESGGPPGFPATPAGPPGAGPQAGMPAAPSPPANIGPTNLPPGSPPPPEMPRIAQMPAGAGAAGGMPSLPMMMPPPMTGKAEVTATGDKTNLLGFACARYELKQRGETMEIWATDKLFPFQPYLGSQPHRFGPSIEEQWGGTLKAKKLFPMLTVLKVGNGPERLRFEVKSIQAEKIRDDDGKQFQPPPDYQELQPLPF